MCLIKSRFDQILRRTTKSDDKCKRVPHNRTFLFLVMMILALRLLRRSGWPWFCLNPLILAIRLGGPKLSPEKFFKPRNSRNARKIQTYSPESFPGSRIWLIILFAGGRFLNDSGDDFILELAVAANARYIVTHNLRNFAGVESFGLEAIAPAQMLLKLQENK